MAKRPRPGNCTYCLRFSNKLTWDHVLPVSWYPDSTPADMEKWKVPACRECNKSLGRIEEKLLIRLGLCLEPNSISALGISHKSLRAVSPQYAKNERDRRIRERKREKLLGEVIHFDEPPDEGLFPHFGPLPWLRYDGYHAVLIPEVALKSYTEKLVRGLSLILDGNLLGENYQIELYVIQEDGDRRVLQMFEGRYNLYHRGLGFIVRRMVREDDKAWIYGFEIWQRLKFYAVAHPGDLEELKAQFGVA
jgi:hypothetical protein